MPKKKIKKTNYKKTIYVILTIFLGKLLGLIAFELLSLDFIKASAKSASPVEFNQIFGLVYSPLPADLFWFFIAVGAIGGFFLGLHWWEIVYVKHLHWSNWCKRK